MKFPGRTSTRCGKLTRLYAESRGLLPVPDNALYSRSYSLDAMKKRLDAARASGSVSPAGR